MFYKSALYSKYSYFHCSNHPFLSYPLPHGRQLGSFRTVQDMEGVGTVPMTFIRAPYIENVENGVEVLSRFDGKAVAVKYGSQLGLSFHPELDEDDRIHKLFLEECSIYSA